MREKEKKNLTVLAAAAHPDDIEFMMAGTLLLLKKAGAKIHFFTLANGSCGTDEYSREEIILMRSEEAQASAREAGAHLFPPLVDDIQIFYEPFLLAKVAAVIRESKPDILLVPSPDDYMEDHQNACRLLATAAFVRGMPNYRTDPPLPPWNGETVLYHAMPHGLSDSLRRQVRPGQYVNIGSVLERKRKMLSLHRTQKEWLDKSQGIDAYLRLMETFSREVGALSGRFDYAEGFRRRAHWGYGPLDYDPLSHLLGDLCWTDPDYEKSLHSLW
ncbi:MAG: PIG-L family deacetylase [Candidatus Latescibacter sp.]|nr:PIG-L family deacetylase [Candidatus Latescibacter sp.]